MAVNFVQQKRKQKYLLYIVGIVIVITIIVLWLGYFRKSEAPIVEQPLPSATVSRITIDLEVLKRPILKKLELFEDIPAFEGKKGRVNPFLSY